LKNPQIAGTLPISSAETLPELGLEIGAFLGIGEAIFGNREQDKGNKLTMIYFYDGFGGYE